MSREFARRAVVYKMLSVLVIVLMIAVAMPFIDQKLTFLNLFFLPVILAALWLGARSTFTIAFLCISVIAVYISQNPGKFLPSASKTDLYSLLFSQNGDLRIIII